MTLSVSIDQVQFARQVLDDASPFVKAVTELAERQEIVASENIYARNGMKLVSKGANLSGRFYDRLVAHKLLKPIEQSLVACKAPDAKRLVSLAYDECRRIPSLAPLMEQPAVLERMQGFLGGIAIPAPLALRLAVMQDSRPKLFQHSLIVSMVAMVLGVREELPLGDLQALAIASIFHDVGELSIAPELFADGHRLTDDEHRYLFTHPITGFLMLRDFRELPKGAAQAVLQHHERLDGSGYPNRAAGAQITRLSRSLAVAESVASLLEREGADHRIGMKLRLNHEKFDHQAVALICDLLGDARSTTVPPMSGDDLATGFDRVSEIFAGWSAFRSALSPADIEAVSYLVERVETLRAMVLEMGIDEYRLPELIPAPGSPDDIEIRTELSVLFDELVWQFRALTREIEHKLFVRGWSLPASRRDAFSLWLTIVRRFAGESA